MTAPAFAPSPDVTQPRRRRDWTKAEDRRLEMLWGEMSLGHIAQLLDRAVGGVYVHAARRGLPLGLQPGMEYVRNAAARCGFSHAGFAAILAWAGIKPQRTMSLQVRGAYYQRRMVDTMEADDAVAAWLASENVTEAANRRGLEGRTLGVWLQKSGLEMPPKPPGKKIFWRVPTAVIDRCLADRAGREMLHEAAARVGISRNALSEILKAAGIPRTTGHYWHIDKAVVDRVVAEARAARPKLGEKHRKSS